MKSKIGLLFLCGASLLAISGCTIRIGGEKEVTVVDMDGNKETFKYYDNFEYEPVEKEGYYFMGLYIEQNLNSSKLVEYTGQMVSTNIQLPETIYAMYIKQTGPQIIDTEYADKDVSRFSDYEFKLDDAYKHYFEKNDYIGYLNISFSHFEKEEGVSGVNTFNWLKYELETDKGLIENGTLRSNSDFTPFNRLYKLDKKQLFDKITFSVHQPDENISIASPRITSMRFKLYLGFENDLAEFKYSNLAHSQYDYVTTYFEDNSATINNSYSTSASLKYKFPFNLCDWINETKTEKIRFSVTIPNYGNKLLLLSNWVEGTFVLSKDYEKTIKLERNSSGDEDTFSITVPLEDAKTITQAVVNINHPSANASSAFYYVWSISLGIYRVSK